MNRCDHGVHGDLCPHPACIERRASQQKEPYYPAPADLAQAVVDLLAIWDGSEDGQYGYSSGPVERLDEIRKLAAKIPNRWLEPR